ncbi:MAG: zinc transporter ZupT [Candidatus Diapherotrites archaeon]
MEFLPALMLSLLAGLSTCFGSIIAFFLKKPKPSMLPIAMGFSAGVMIFVSFAEMLPQAISNIGQANAFIAFFAGMGAIYLIDVSLPHSYEGEKCQESRLLKCGTLVAIGIAIHNFPEGIAVFFSSLSSISLGIPIAIAIALHNIPEGIAISMPIFQATKSRKKAFLYSALSGLTEPLGAIIGFLFLSAFLNQFILYLVLAGVAGIMVFISFDELLPYTYEGKQSHKQILGVFLGMAVMALSLWMLG